MTIDGNARAKERFFMHRLSVAIVLLVSVAACVSAAEKKRDAGIAVTIKDQAGRPVPAARIAFIGLKGRTDAVADDVGRATLNPPAGEGWLLIGRKDFRFRGEWSQGLTSPI